MIQNIRFLVKDDAVACEDLLISRLVLLHLCLDTRTLLADRVVNLNGTECRPEGLHQQKGGHVSRLMLACIKNIGNDQQVKAEKSPINPVHPKAIYFRAPPEKGILPDPSLLDSVDSEQHGNINKAVQDLQKAAFDNELAEDKRPHPTSLFTDHMDIFRTLF